MLLRKRKEDYTYQVDPQTFLSFFHKICLNKKTTDMYMYEIASSLLFINISSYEYAHCCYCMLATRQVSCKGVELLRWNLLMFHV